MPNSRLIKSHRDAFSELSEPSERSRFSYENSDFSCNDNERRQESNHLHQATLETSEATHEKASRSVGSVASIASDNIPIARRQPPQQTNAAGSTSNPVLDAAIRQDSLRFHFDYCECDERLYGRPAYADCLLAIQQLPYYTLTDNVRREIYGMGGPHPTPVTGGVDGPPIRTPIVRGFRKKHAAVVGGAHHEYF